MIKPETQNTTSEISSIHQPLSPPVTEIFAIVGLPITVAVFRDRIQYSNTARALPPSLDAHHLSRMTQRRCPLSRSSFQ
jgi:hypothetical protein